MKKTFILLFFFCATKIFAQTPTVPAAGVTLTQAIPASADAASLGKYGSIPVSAYTGVPNISIPLYTIKSGDLTLPISLSYHSGGFKVEEMASSVGLGWVLNAGGNITRTQRGKADEDLNGSLTTGYAASIDSSFRNYNTLTSAQKSQLDIYLNEVADGTIDGEADVFNYNFGSYSGKFTMDSHSHFYTIPLANIQFAVTVTGGQTTNITGFTAKTPDGVTYYFGSSAATEYTNSPANKRQTSMSWFVYKITSPSFHEIDFTYTPENYTTNQVANQTIYAALGYIAGFQPVNPPATPPAILPSGNAVIYTTVKLQSISFENGSLTVYSNSNRNDLNPPPTTIKATAIDSIYVIGSGLSKKYRFYYLNTVSNRLRLDSLIGQLESISGTNRYKKEKYSFTYNTDPWTNNLNADFLFAQDWWGYYNGHPGSYYGTATTLPTTTYSVNGNMVTIPGASRASDEPSQMGGLLKQITYPTGGYSQFSFEANDESNINLQGTSSTRYPKNSYTTAFSNDNTSIYYNYDTNNGNPNNLMTIYAAANTTVPVNFTAYGLATAQPPPAPPYPQVDYVNINVYSQDSNGNYTVLVATVNGTSSTINLAAGTYQLQLSDPKGQTNPANFTYYIKYSVAAQWASYSNAEIAAMTGNYIVGGARIHQIADYDGINPNPINLKTYSYKLPGTTVSSGYLNFQPVFYYNLDIETNNNSGGIPNNSVYRYFTLTSYSNYPLATTQGSVVGYSHVDELLGPTGQNGMNEYFYTNSASNPDFQQVPGFPFAPAESQDWHRGLLLKETAWKSSGSGTYSKVHETANVYSTVKNFTYPPLIKAGFNPKPSVYSQFASYYTNPTAIEWGRIQEVTYHDLSDFTYMSSDTTRIYDQVNPSQFLQTVNKYQFDTTTYQLTQLQTVNSKNERITQIITYPNNYNAFGSTGVANLNNNGITTYPIEEITQKSDTNGNNLRTVKAVYTTYKLSLPYRDSVYEMRSVAGVPNFVLSTSGQKDSHYQPVVAFNKYDVYGNIMQEQKVGDALHTYIWGYRNSSPSPANNTYPIAEVINADSAHVAYTNFEQLSNSATSWGNWTFSLSSVITDVTAPMGAQCYSVSGTNTLVKSGLNTAVTYVVSFWAKSGAAITVSGGTVTNVATGNAKSGWIYHEYSTTGATSVTIGGTGSIDEVRLYPSTAQMTTYTYTPLVGMASKCDTKNDITYFIYDNVGRVIQVLDQNQNIVKQYQYNYQNSGQ